MSVLTTLFPKSSVDDMRDGVYLIFQEDGAIWIGDFYDRNQDGELYLRGGKEPISSWGNAITAAYGPIDELELAMAVHQAHKEEQPAPQLSKGEQL